MRKWALLAVLILAALWGNTVAAQQARIVVNRDNVNIRRVPSFAGQILATANAGTTFDATGRTVDNQWVRVQFGAEEAWVSAVVATFLEGNIGALAVGDPSAIPYGGQGSPRAGATEATSGLRGRFPDNGVHLRAGPNTGYFIFAEIPRFAEVPLLGRTIDNAWTQVNYQGNLGWVATRYLQVLDNGNFSELPVDGIVASAAPENFEAQVVLFEVLRGLRERLDLAQPSLDQQRQVWVDAALGQAPFCGAYPASPTDFTIRRDVYALYFDSIDPLLREFNEAMQSIRLSIELQQVVCGRPASDVVLVSVPVVTGGLEFVNVADAKMADLRRRIDALLPEYGPEDCIFQFAGRVDILPFAPTYADGRIGLGEFTPDSPRSVGVCFYATPAQIYRVEFIRPSANYKVTLAVSPIDNPTNFIAAASGGPSDEVNGIVIDPIEFTQEGLYLLLIYVEPEPATEIPVGEYAYLLIDVTGGTPPSNLLVYNSASGDFTIDTSVTTAATEVPANQTGQQTATAGTTATVIGFQNVSVYASPSTTTTVIGQLLPGERVTVLATQPGWVQVQQSNGTPGWVQDTLVSVSTS
jgi:uncharacterized protein YgiM (DUF1202 family)